MPDDPEELAADGADIAGPVIDEPQPPPHYEDDDAG